MSWSTAPVIRGLTPRHRRWRRLLDGLSLDPEGLERPLTEPSNRDFMICGPSRSGTSLLAAELHQPPSCITIMEPWDGMRLAPAPLFDSLRREAITGTVRRGRLDVGELKRSGEVRWGRDEEHPYRVELTSEFALGVKWPIFWRYLDLLPRTKFLICVRHPVEVISSFTRTGGRLTEGLDYDIAFNRRMNDHLRTATDDPAVRRALLFEYVAARIAPHLDDPNVFVVPYERWFTDRDALMHDIGGFLGVKLGAGYPKIRRAHPVQLEPELVDLVERYCPSTASLGYEARVPAI